MSQENQSCLRFSLEETLWFRKGQEVEELISISLDPDITIQESDQYVTIRGSLELTGEYKSYEISNEQVEESKQSQKFIERVAEIEEGNSEFSHRFPVDITIPNNRIKSIYDIDVLVESFDYSFPERSCLKLSAELTISGLYASEPQEEEEKEEELELLHRQSIANDAEELEAEETIVQSSYQDQFLFNAEARKHQEEQPPTFPKYPNFHYQPQEQYEPEPFMPPWEYQDARSEGKTVEVEAEEEIVVEDLPDEPIYLEKDATVTEESSSSSVEGPKQKIKKLFTKKKSMTLTEFFARKDENQAQTRLKMCIVQKGDTVERIAERYDVTAQHLLRVNNLEINQDVFEGQVLYIPAAFAKK
ncbi:stage VI sporulation protein D [Bacillus sp. BRMEA1]|uniref:stage VI sporulation protein D n=1 Tax=Neobacillus endophyticus TaxID=2738405 RepID=UPI00156468EA|nr:stage VI sporulation protein D [Neobacillus endophyticus]NRD76021.1 stage VI sporulation protein D [Neobacillus endophyticus]